MKDQSVIIDKAADLLGPVMLYWLHKLHQDIRYLDDGQTQFLFCARAGVRIQELYDIFCQERGLGTPPAEMFWISRLAVCKGVFARTPQASAELLQREFAGQSLAELLKCLMRDAPDTLAAIKVADNQGLATIPCDQFSVWVHLPHKASQLVLNYLTETSTSFDSYLKSVAGDARKVVLIDSGWRGTAQSMLAQAYPDRDWYGLYFGLIPAGGLHPDIADKTVGAVFQSNHYDANRPETALTHYRHLIEATFEPNGPSIETAPANKESAAANADIATNLNDRPDPVLDATYIDLKAYIRSAAKLSLTEVHVNSQAALRQLAERIMYPTPADVDMLTVKPRSADFGKDFSVSVVAKDTPGQTRSPEQRMQETLWYQGQAALEYSPHQARRLQADRASIADASEGSDTSRKLSAAAHGKSGTVAIITRTKDRPILLRRAAESVASQSYGNFIWVVVNDGGDPGLVGDVLNDCLVEKRKIIVIHHDVSQGMEAASNAGIAAISTDYVLIHDDDDAIAPNFLETTVSFLQGSSGRKYAGVITKSTLVTEDLVGHEIHEKTREPFMGWVTEVQLAEMATGNFFPPISFLYRREMWTSIGGYDETLPVLGDWRFNLDFLSRADIGVIPEAMAFYHMRTPTLNAGQAMYSNSVIGQQNLHQEYDTIVRNKIIRNQAKDPVLAALVATAYLHKATRSAQAYTIAQTELPPTVQKVNDLGWMVSHTNGTTVIGQAIIMAAKGIFPISHTFGRLILKFAFAKRLATTKAEPTFNESAYLDANPDVCRMVNAGKLPLGYVHFVLHGQAETRDRPSL